MPLTPADVRNKQFSTTRLRPGYDEEEVDAFLDEVEAALDELIQDNEELRAKLAEVLRGKPPVSLTPQAEVPEMMQPEPIRHEPERRPEPVMMSPRPVEDNMDTAARVLALAQQTADQAIADARREADETLGRARREAGARTKEDLQLGLPRIDGIESVEHEIRKAIPVHIAHALGTPEGGTWRGGRACADQRPGPHGP